MRLFEIPWIINSVEKSRIITKKKIEVLPISNHEEADTKLLFHLRMNNEAIGIVAKDVNYALSQVECFLPPSYMKIDSLMSPLILI